jgi:hypothetical protein
MINWAIRQRRWDVLRTALADDVLSRNNVLAIGKHHLLNFRWEYKLTDDLNHDRRQCSGKQMGNTRGNSQLMSSSIICCAYVHTYTT